MEWKTIDSAPRNGESVWAYQGPNYHQCQMKWISGEGYSLWIYTDEILSDIDPDPEQPTHWMPLPPPPQEQEE